MRRAFRFVWVLGVNGAFVYFIYSQHVGDSPIVFILKAAAPAVGVVVEAAHWRFAKWVNVGYLTLVTLYWLGGAVYWWSDSYHGVLLIIGVGFMIVTGLTERVYHYTSVEE